MTQHRETQELKPSLIITGAILMVALAFGTVGFILHG